MRFGPDCAITDWPGIYLCRGYKVEMVDPGSYAPMLYALVGAFLISWVACMVWSS